MIGWDITGSLNQISEELANRSGYYMKRVENS